jgi:hypothetical protein
MKFFYLYLVKDIEIHQQLQRVNISEIKQKKPSITDGLSTLW